MYCTRFKRALRKCESVGSTIPAAEHIAISVYGLNLVVYEQYIRDYATDPDSVPNTIGAVMADTVDYLQRVVGVNPALGKVLDHSSKGFVAYSAETVSEPFPVIMAAEVDIKCQLCDRANHTAPFCYRLRDADFVAKLVAAQPNKKGSSEKGAGRRAKKEDRKAPLTSGSNAPSIDSTVSAASEDLHFAPVSLDPTDSTYLSVCLSNEAARTFNVEHDDHAEVSVLNEDATDLLESTSICDDHVSGVVPGAGVHITTRGMLKMDMGRAVVVPNSPRLLASGPELRKSYHWQASGSEIRYTHKVTGASLIFRMDPIRFKDQYFHMIVETEPKPSNLVSTTELGCCLNEYAPESSPIVCTMSGGLDFYDPPPLLPVPPALADSAWPMIRAVERFHWNTCHMGAEAMTRMCQQSGYVGDVTPEGIALFARHRGCSACLLGTMAAHHQLESSRGLSSVVGEVMQGDIFFVEADPGRRMVPILIAACEASKLMYAHTFVDAFTRASSGRIMVRSSEMQAAFEHLVAVCESAGHPLRILRFDRERAVTAGNVGPWLKLKGVDLVLTAAGQKLGLGEVCGRIVKDRCR
jgi:hypothetical protein